MLLASQSYVQRYPGHRGKRKTETRPVPRVNETGKLNESGSK